jgi:hypothetical protein
MRILCMFLVALAWSGHHFIDALRSKRTRTSRYNGWRFLGFGRAAESRSFSCSRLACVQAAATARIAGKSGIHNAAYRGDAAAVHDHLIADARCVNMKNSMYDSASTLAHAFKELAFL